MGGPGHMHQAKIVYHYNMLILFNIDRKNAQKIKT